MPCRTTRLRGGRVMAAIHDMQDSAFCGCCAHHHRDAEAMCGPDCGPACWCASSVQSTDDDTGAEQGCHKITCCGIIQCAIPQQQIVILADTVLHSFPHTLQQPRQHQTNTWHSSRLLVEVKAALWVRLWACSTVQSMQATLLMQDTLQQAWPPASHRAQAQSEVQ